MRQGFPSIHRMARCKHCPHHCKPCLTIDEAEAIYADTSRRTFHGNDICQECHRKSVASTQKNPKDKDDGLLDSPEGKSQDELNDMFGRLMLELGRL